MPLHLINSPEEEIWRAIKEYVQVIKDSPANSIGSGLNPYQDRIAAIYKDSPDGLRIEILYSLSSEAREILRLKNMFFGNNATDVILKFISELRKIG